jgi:ABC-type Zn uptake system ZnuABC Zn-binding protein ZnuA
MMARLSGLLPVFFCGLLGLLVACSRPAARQGPVKVVTTLGVLADWARNVGDGRVQVRSLLTGLEGEHTYEPRPSDLKLIAGADILFRVGLGLEDWLDPVIQNVNNPRLATVDAAQGVQVIRDGRSAGNAPGNPHIWLDPEDAKIGIENLVRQLIRMDPGGETLYRSRQQAYYRRLDSLTRAITAEVSALPDRRFISFHPAWPYFARRFGFEVVASIEPIPGQEPSARRIAELADLIRQQHIKVICSEPQLPSDVPNTLAREAGARVIILSPLTDGVPETGDYVSLIGYNARTIIGALR